MKRVVPMLALLVLLVAFGGAMWVYTGMTSGPTPLSLEDAQGEVALERRGELLPGEVGVELSPGDRVRTGEDGSAVLSRGGRSPIALANNTSVRLVSVDEEVVELALEGGRVKARVRPDAGAVRISSGERSVLATNADFSVGRADDALQVEVESGGLAVAGVRDLSRVEQGQVLHVLADGSSAVGDIPDELLLDVAWPSAGRVEMVTVSGNTEPGAIVTVVAKDPVQATADAQGRFLAQVALPPGRTSVQVSVRDIFGRVREAEAFLVRDSEAPTYQLDVGFGTPR